MNLNVYWKNHPAFKITISKEKTLLDLKTAIANHFNEKYTGFNVLNGTSIYDKTFNSKTLRELKIARVIRLPVNYNPGYGKINK
jgi:hypothetical protein